MDNTDSSTDQRVRMFHLNGFTDEDIVEIERHVAEMKKMLGYDASFSERFLEGIAMAKVEYEKNMKQLDK